VGLILNFTDWEHHDHTNWNTIKYTVNEPLGNITGTFFGKIQGLPTDYPVRSPWSHDLENCECTESFLHWETAVKLAGKILNVLVMYWVGMNQVH
jgi:hypothetical protein